MNRYDSRICLLDADVLDSVHQDELEADSCSSGYESSASTDDEVSHISQVITSTPGGVYSRPPRTPREVMMFTNSGAFHDSLSLITSMPELCDVTFLVSKERVPVHGVKAILATRSRCLYQLILQHQRKMDTRVVSKKSKKTKSSTHPQQLTIDVTDYQADDFKKFVNFVHSGKVKVDVRSAIGLLCAASEFGFRDLHTACLDFIHICKGQGHLDILLDLAWGYQHKKAAQKLICQLSGVAR